MKVRLLLHACKLCPKGSPLRRRYQIGLVLHRKNRNWKTRYAHELVAKYGAEDGC